MPTEEAIPAVVIGSVPAATKDAQVTVAFGPEAFGSEPAPAPRPDRWRLHRLSIAVLLIGLLVTAALAVASRLNYVHNEQRQVDTQAQLTAAALAVAPVDVQRRLGRATTLVSATGDVGLFAGAVKASVPTPFTSVALYRVVNGAPQRTDTLGQPTLLQPGSTQLDDVLKRATASGSLALTRVATPTAQRLGYAMSVTSRSRTYVSYAEQVLPADRRQEISPGSPLGDMTFALYFGKEQTASALMETNARTLPISGSVGQATVPFGDQALTLVMTPRTPLLGVFAASMSWLIAAAGLLLTGTMALLAERLARRRAVAEQLAAVTGELYRTQRGVAETLQTALLPDVLPTSPTLAVATRYLTGTEGIEVGGDWYDLISLPGNRMFFTIGDVSGRGLSAATMMSRLRHSITAYAVEGNDTATVLAKVSGLIDLGRDGHFATALCGIVDLSTGKVVLSNAGHPPLVLVADGRTEPVAGPVGPPLGVGSHYEMTAIRLTPGSTLLAYTDGLIERRDVPIDERIAYLCRVARPGTNVENLLATVLAALVPHGASEDDTAILGLQWIR